MRQDSWKIAFRLRRRTNLDVAAAMLKLDGDKKFLLLVIVNHEPVNVCGYLNKNLYTCTFTNSNINSLI